MHAGLRMFFALLLGLMGLTAVGCGKVPTGEVSGRVTFDGRPIPLGTIAFLRDDGQLASGVISGGDYKVPGVPTGEVRITIASHEAPIGMAFPDESAANSSTISARAPAVKLPARFADAATSGQKLTVTPGAQRHDLQLAP